MPLVIAASATFVAGGITVLNGTAEVIEGSTGYNYMRDGVYGGNKGFYEAQKNIASTTAAIGTAAITAGTATGGICFAAGTLVQTEDGTKPVEEIERGDRVLAWEEKTGQTALKPVLETYVNETRELVHVFVGGEEIVCTPSHPFYSPVKGWTEAVHLRAGDILVLVNGEYVVVEKVQHELLEAPINVYNFNVEGFHTYYVSGVGVLVHNRCGVETHHIVEQSQVGKSGFASSQIQDASNKIDIPYSMHRRISGFFSSKQPFTDGMRVRDWLVGKSFEYQSKFGWDVVMRFWE